MCQRLIRILMLVVVFAASYALAKDTDRDGVPDDRDMCPDIARGSIVNEVGCYDFLEIDTVNDNAAPAPQSLTILFEFDSAQIQPVHLPAIKQFLGKFDSSGSLSFMVEGHTDSMGTDAYNLSLSRARAHSVMALLSSNFGILAGNLQQEAFGEHSPVASNATASGRERNRRAVIKIHE